MVERIWTDVEPGEYSISDYEVSKKLIRLLRHGSLPREDDGAIEFCRIQDNLPEHLTTNGRKPWQEEEEETRKHINIVLIHQESLIEFICSRLMIFS